MAASSFARGADVYWNKMKANKIVFLGNSMTLHGPKSDIGWSGNWGMAATEQANDYVHRLVTTVNATAGTSLAIDRAGDDTDGTVNNVINIADIYERNYSAYNSSKLQTEIDYRPNIVVLQFGENLASVSTPSEKAAFKASLENLIGGFKTSSDPMFFVTSYIMSSNSVVDTIKQEVCNADPMHRVFVDLSGFRNDGTNYAAGEYVGSSPYKGLFTNGGVLGHPGNKGMKYIADHLYSAMAAQSTAVPEPTTWMLLLTGTLAVAVGRVWRQRKRENV
jgi:alpha-galactosidase